MATDILSIPQIEVTKQDMLQNDMHIGQGADISRRLQNARWTDSTHQTKVFPDNVDALMAVKVGGLFLALNGVAVKPTDDVDAEKEYELIPIE